MRAIELRPEHQDILSAIVEGMPAARRPGLSKTAQLSEAISALILSGRIAAGAKLPGERELSAAVSLSLGTVQKALNVLMTDGKLTREHGRGTFARADRHPLDKLWHYRFLAPGEKRLLPVFATVIDRVVMPPPPYVAAALGRDPLGCVRIRRVINIDDRFSCWSEMFLPASRFGRLVDMPISDVESVNLKQLLNAEFAAPTLSVAQTARIDGAPAGVCERLGVARRTRFLLLRVTGFSRREQPISFQTIHVPPVNYDLELTTEPYESSRLLAA
jgi:GntR family transcriptional regulator